nr:hypothetical protein [Tanacetum cinerariifolium]
MTELPLMDSGFVVPVYSPGDDLTTYLNKPMAFLMAVASLSSGLIPNIVSQQPCIPPKRDDWDHLFQPMFDEYFTPSSIAVSIVPVATAPRAVDLADSPVSTNMNTTQAQQKALDDALVAPADGIEASAKRLRSDGEDSTKEISTQSEGEYRLGAIGSNSDPYWKI